MISLCPRCRGRITLRKNTELIEFAFCAYATAQSLDWRRVASGQASRS
jgi:hypothetical protein